LIVRGHDHQDFHGKLLLSASSDEHAVLDWGGKGVQALERRAATARAPLRFQDD
jgi:hypothetical protein